MTMRPIPMTRQQEALRVALFTVLNDASDLGRAERLAVMSAALGQVMAAHMQDAKNPQALVNDVLANIDIGRRSISQ